MINLERSHIVRHSMAWHKLAEGEVRLFWKTGLLLNLHDHKLIICNDVESHKLEAVCRAGRFPKSVWSGM